MANTMIQTAEKPQAVPPMHHALAEKPSTVPSPPNTGEPTGLRSPRVPDVPRAFVAPQALLGAVPAHCAPGFEVTRIPNTPEAIAQAKSHGQVVVYAGDRNPDHPEEPLIQNEDMFAKNPDGTLTYRGDLLVIWRSEYAQASREQDARTARAASDGVKIRRVALTQTMHLPEELTDLEAGFGIRG